jgi:hypothetical protein
MGAHVARSAGKTCHHCSDAPVPGRSCCKVHLEMRREQEAARRAGLKASGKCVVCAARAAKGLTVCTRHREYYRARAALSKV